MIWCQSGYFLTFCLVGRKNAISHCINIQLVNFVFIERSTRLRIFSHTCIPGSPRKISNYMYLRDALRKDLKHILGYFYKPINPASVVLILLPFG